MESMGPSLGKERPPMPRTVRAGPSRMSIVISIMIPVLVLAAIMISQSEEGKLSKEDADLLNHHIAISHSQLEDTLLFVAMGYHFGILVLPRILLSVVYVWLRRFELWFRLKRTQKNQVSKVEFNFPKSL